MGNDQSQQSTADASLVKSEGITEQFSVNFTESKYKSKEEFMTRYDIKKTIGEGGQAYVKEAFDSVNLEFVALKIFRKEQMNFFALNAANLEYETMHSLKHDNILKCKDYFEDNDYLIIVNELQSTDLQSLLQTLDSPLTESYIKTIFRQMLESMEYCHQKNIIHRDVKLENFLVSTTENEEILIKLSDFGLACRYDPEEPPREKCGSLHTSAPELIAGKSYCHKVDLWGMGVILHQLLSTELPFYSQCKQTFMKQIVTQHITLDDKIMWKGVSGQAKDLIKQLLDKNPSSRLSASEALNHPWFSEETKFDEFDESYGYISTNAESLSAISQIFD